MIRSTRKQREIEARERRILDVARSMLLEEGYLGLRMDRIADQMEYSKGTIYQHFPNKEEIVLALANQALSKRSEFFAAASTLRQASRDRLVAVGAAAELFVELFPHFFQVEQVVRVQSIWEKTSEQRRQLMRSCETRCMEILGGIVRDAIAAGDVCLPDGCVPEDLVFGLWAINTGSFVILASSESLHEIGIHDGVAALRRNQNLMLDGYHWQPLSSQVDFNAVMDVVKTELMTMNVVRT